MKKLINILSPTKVLIFFAAIVLICVTINYVSQHSESPIKYVHIRKVQLFNIFCFFPAMAFFLGISIYNFCISKRNNNKKDMRISLVPIYLIGLLCSYIFFMLFYTVFIREIG